MRTTISIPNDLFEAAENLARELGVSRSHLYSRALAAFVGDERRSDVTARLDAVYSEREAKLDPVLEHIQLRSLPRDEW